jgi:outer membrane receptor for ferrienterochelin and colicin
MKYLLLLLLFPVFGFSQDTLFSKQLSEVTIKAVGQKNTESSVIRSVRNSSTISDGLSVEFIKKTPDRTVGDALKRVNGVTIQNDKFVLVRGLNDRYNLALLNKTYLPSTEPDRRAFSFDIIPSGLIDNIIVAKSATANLLLSCHHELSISGVRDFCKKPVIFHSINSSVPK